MLSSAGIISSAYSSPGKIWIEFSTSDPSLTKTATKSTRSSSASDDGQCMTPEVQRPLSDAASHWLLVLCLVGLDYFSTLAYLPSLAVAAAGALAPLAALAVVLITLCVALPIYGYIVGRSASGRGAAGLLEQVMPGWRGKLVVLTVLGFAAADFVITRSLSVADAAMHVSHNPHGLAIIDRLSPAMESLTPWLPAEWLARLRPLLSRQVVITLGIAVLTFGFWQLLQRGFTRRVLWLAGTLVTIYLVLVGIVVGSGLIYVAAHPDLWHNWWHAVQDISSRGSFFQHPIAGIATLSFLSLWAFPQLALGLSGFELTMTLTPLVRGGTSRDDQKDRIGNSRKLLCAAAGIMAVLITGSVLVATLLVPREALAPGGLAEDRALAYLAHGGPLADGERGSRVNSCFGDSFGNVFDASTIAVLSLAGASVITGLRGMLPHYLHRLGMALTWAGQTGVVMHLLNVIILIVTVAFHASISTQQWAYATSVLVLVAGAALAAGLDVWRRLHRLPLRWLIVAPILLSCAFFLAMTAVTTFTHPSGVIIASSFVVAIVVSSFVSRWLRSTELRFEGFAFSDEATRIRWEAICRREFQVVVPHRPGLLSLSDKNLQIQREFRLNASVPILFVEATLGDPSEFYHQPLMTIADQDGLEVLRVSKCVSVAHVLASICLALCRPGGRPPEVIFGWSNERPLAANLNFLLLGEGNIPWMVRELVRHAVPDVRLQPRIHIG